MGTGLWQRLFVRSLFSSSKPPSDFSHSFEGHTLGVQTHLLEAVSCFPGNWLREVQTGGDRDFCPWEQSLTKDDGKLLEKCFLLPSLGGDDSERYWFSFQRAWQNQILYENTAL